MGYLECLGKTYTSEFFLWNKYLDEVTPNEFQPIHYYLAQIAKYIIQCNAAKKVEVDVNDLLLKFERKEVKREKDVEEMTEDELEERRKRIEFYFLTQVGLGVPEDGIPSAGEPGNTDNG